MIRGLRLVIAGIVLAAQIPLFAQEILPVRVRVDLEPLWMLAQGGTSPLEREAAHRQALEESRYLLAAMVYGWDFSWTAENRLRGVAEYFEALPRGEIPFGDEAFNIVELEVEESHLHSWAEYTLSDVQLRWLASWESGTVYPAQALGQASLELVDAKKAALADAAKNALISILRQREKNRPKEVSGEMVLVQSPRFWIDEGCWKVQARFRFRVRALESWTHF